MSFFKLPGGGEAGCYDEGQDLAYAGGKVGPELNHLDMFKVENTSDIIH